MMLVSVYINTYTTWTQSVLLLEQAAANLNIPPEANHMQVRPSKQLVPSRPPQQLEQYLDYTQRVRMRKPKTLLEQHLETISAAQYIHLRTQQLRAATARLCGN